MNILAFAASNSRKSINKDLINYAATLLDQHDVEIIDINDYDMPIYSSDLEEAHGIPGAALSPTKKGPLCCIPRKFLTQPKGLLTHERQCSKTKAFILTQGLQTSLADAQHQLI